MAIDNEKLSGQKLEMDELDQVAGGSREQTSRLFVKLHDFGLISRAEMKAEDMGAFNAACGKYGVYVETHRSRDNRYFIKGKEVSRDEALYRLEHRIKD